MISIKNEVIDFSFVLKDRGNDNWLIRCEKQTHEDEVTVREFYYICIYKHTISVY